MEQITAARNKTTNIAILSWWKVANTHALWLCTVMQSTSRGQKYSFSLLPLSVQLNEIKGTTFCQWFRTFVAVTTMCDIGHNNRNRNCFLKRWNVIYWPKGWDFHKLNLSDSWIPRGHLSRHAEKQEIIIRSDRSKPGHWSWHSPPTVVLQWPCNIRQVQKQNWAIHSVTHLHLRRNTEYFPLPHVTHKLCW